MAHSLGPNILLCVLLLFSIISLSTCFRPKALFLPITKDPSTLQYITQIKQRTPLVPINLAIDLGGQFLWVDCDQDYVSSSYKPARCNSAQCSLAKSKACGDCFSTFEKPGCNNNTCSLFPENPVTSTGTMGELAQDIVSIQSTDGSNPGQVVSVAKFIFTCGSTFLLQGLANGVKGMAGLGRTKVSLPYQFSAAFSFPKKFAICLPSSSNGDNNGVVFFGDKPYNFLPFSMDMSNYLTYTPLILNPVSTASSSFEGEKSSEYFIGVKSIKVNNKVVRFNTTLLDINNDGFGGTKISTVHPYTIMETSIYKAFVKTYVNVLSNVPRVKPVAPFETCFDAKKIESGRVGPSVPQIDLVLRNPEVVWSIFGANSMVGVNKDVICLGFVDGGSDVRTSIVIGGHQIENNLLQFDLATSRLGFSSSLLFHQTTCSNFNLISQV